VFDKNTVYFDWEKGELLVLDNILSAHGRTPFKGERSILVSMIS
ncbi:MAG: TauD/TfdA family dioxygenase, partial [Bacteroidota bacterium]